MLCVTLEKWTSSPVYRFMRAAYHQARPVVRPAFVPFDRRFGHAQKRHRVAPQAVPTPEAAAMHLKEDATHLQQDVYTVPEDFTATLDGALVCPEHNVVLTADGEVVVESSNAGKPEYFARPLFSARRPERFVPGHSALWRSHFHNYYHLLIDALPRLLALRQPPYDRLDEIKLLCPGGLTETERFFLSELELENVRPVALDEQFRYRAEHLIFTPVKAQCQSGYLPARYVKRLRGHLWPNRPSRGDVRLFVSREQADRRVLSNREALMRALRPLGFRKVILEDMSPQEQIETLYDAGAVVGTHGAGLANMLFAPPGLEVVELFPTRYVVPHYFFLSKSLGHRHAYHCGAGDDIGLDEFAVDVPAVRALLDRLDVNAGP